MNAFLSKNMFKYPIYFIAVIFLFFMGGVFASANATTVNVPTSNFSGYAWSDNIGWISFGSCSPVFGVGFDPATNKLSGYAWSDNVGWISFNESDLTSCPSGECNAKYVSGSLTGWAKAISGSIENGWDGWISLNKKSSDLFNYGPLLQADGKSIRGYAWGSDAIGWIDFVSVAIDDMTITTPSSYDNWIAYTLDDSKVFVSQYPPTKYSFSCDSFYVYETKRFYNGTSASFLANPENNIRALADLPVGFSSGSRLVFNSGKFSYAPISTKSGVVNNLFSATPFIENKYICDGDLISSSCRTRYNPAKITVFSHVLAGNPVDNLIKGISDEDNTSVLLGPWKVLGVYSVAMPVIQSSQPYLKINFISDSKKTVSDKTTISFSPSFANPISLTASVVNCPDSVAEFEGASDPKNQVSILGSETKKVYLSSTKSFTSTECKVVINGVMGGANLTPLNIPVVVKKTILEPKEF